jgi:DNA-binding NarL/FixJ family response regulator
MSLIRVVLIEDHDLTRIGLKAALQQNDAIQVVGEAPDGQQGLEIVRATRPDIAIVDIGLPGIDGIEVTNQIKHSMVSADADEPPVRVLILTMQDNDDAVLAAFAAGADSYSVKDASVEKLIEAIRATYDGNAWIDPAIARIVLQQAQKNQVAKKTAADGTADGSDYEQILESDPLTDRELEVLELIVDGYSNAAIAEELYITVGTVKTHVRNILSKLCAADRTQAAVRALRSGLVSL